MYLHLFITLPINTILFYDTYYCHTGGHVSNLLGKNISTDIDWKLHHQNIYVR